MSKKQKYILLVGDGMGDLPLEELAFKTPLEVAETPAMDHIVMNGELLRLKTIPAGFPPGSDVANLSLLGYLPEECYSGRAPLEAASLGVPLGPDDTAFRCNLVTLNKRQDNALIMEDYSAGHISSAEAHDLIVALDQALGSDLYRFHPGISYRHLLVYKGNTSLQTVPPHDHTGKDISGYLADYARMPELHKLVTDSRLLLEGHEVNRKRTQNGLRPANSIWLWGEGKKPSMKTIAVQFGISGALISAVDLLKGIGVCAGLEIINVKGATGYLDTNYDGKARAALDALDRHDFVLVHVEAPDESSHEGSLEKKMRAIKDFDNRIVAPILDGLQKKGMQFRIAVAMDHYTPLSLRTHTDLPVPVAIMDSMQKGTGSAFGYSEISAEAAPILETGQLFFRRLLGMSS
jgi:2,3-bisphosphoglycerate-independent phosphoglycerate mutase